MSDSANPFITLGQSARTTRSVVAFLDILGFRDRMKSAYSDATAGELLSELRVALDDAGQHLYAGQKGFSGAAQWFVKGFTDNVVLGLPVFGDAESDLGLVFSIVGGYQLAMVKHGFFVRGAISIGDLYMDSEIVFGTGLLEAYEAELTMARDPRIVLASSATEAVKKHVAYYGELQSSPQYRELLVDSDGQVFVNYLDNGFDDEDYTPWVNVLKTHKTRTEELLCEYANRPPIWSKYAWVAGYHNWICDDFGPALSVLKIGQGALRLTPQRLNWQHA